MIISEEEKIIVYKDYVIRVIPFSRSLIAVPKDAKCFYHHQEKGESTPDAIYQLKRLIDGQE